MSNRGKKLIKSIILTSPEIVAELHQNTDTAKDWKKNSENKIQWH